MAFVATKLVRERVKRVRRRKKAAVPMAFAEVSLLIAIPTMNAPAEAATVKPGARFTMGIRVPMATNACRIVSTGFVAAMRVRVRVNRVPPRKKARDTMAFADPLRWEPIRPMNAIRAYVRALERVSRARQRRVR